MADDSWLIAKLIELKMSKFFDRINKIFQFFIAHVNKSIGRYKCRSVMAVLSSTIINNKLNE